MADKFDRAVLAEAKQVTGNSRLRHMDIREWSSSEKVVRDNLEEGETYYALPILGLHIAVEIQ